MTGQYEILSPELDNLIIPNHDDTSTYQCTYDLYYNADITGVDPD